MKIVYVVVANEYLGQKR